MKFRAVIFDLDGTLLDTIPLIRQTFIKVFHDLSIPWGNGEVLKTIGLPLREVAEVYAPERVEEFMSLYAEFQSTRYRELTRVFPGTIETLGALKINGYRTAVVTSKRRPPALAGMSLTGIDRYIEVAVTVDDVSRPKPDPESVVRALDLLNTSPRDSLYVGDSWYDIQAGKQAGVTTVGVTWGMATREEIADAGPDLVVDSWREFLAAL